MCGPRKQSVLPFVTGKTPQQVEDKRKETRPRSHEKPRQTLVSEFPRGSLEPPREFILAKSSALSKIIPKANFHGRSATSSWQNVTFQLATCTSTRRVSGAGSAWPASSLRPASPTPGGAQGDLTTQWEQRGREVRTSQGTALGLHPQFATSDKNHPLCP